MYGGKALTGELCNKVCMYVSDWSQGKRFLDTSDKDEDE